MNLFERALALLPRYTMMNDNWRPDGRFLMTNHNLLPGNIERPLMKLMKRGLCRGKTPWDFRKLRWVDVGSKDNIWVLHRRLKWKSIQYLVRMKWRWQRWKETASGGAKARQLPTLVLYRGRYIVWNGTHRVTLCRLAGKRLRAKVVDLDAYIRWVHQKGDSNGR